MIHSGRRLDWGYSPLAVNYDLFVDSLLLGLQNGFSGSQYVDLVFKTCSLPIDLLLV